MLKPLLSLCVIASGKIQELNKTIESIAKSKKFNETNDVEVVVCDIQYSDKISQYCSVIIKKYPNKVKYIKCTEKINDLNLVQLLLNSTGKLKKLYYEGDEFYDNSIDEILKIINELDEIRPIVLFTNGEIRSELGQNIVCGEINDLIKLVGCRVFCNYTFSIWDSQLEELKNIYNFENRVLLSLSCLLRQYKSGLKFLVLNKKYSIFNTHDIGVQKIDFNVAQQYGDKLINFLLKSLPVNELDLNVINDFKRDILFNFIIPRHFNPDLEIFRTGFNKYLSTFFNDRNFLNYFKDLYLMSNSSDNDVRILINNLIWQKFNDNETIHKNYVDLDKIKVGSRTYGTLSVGAWGAETEQLEIGALCSIGDNVTFMLGGNHELNNLTTFPFKVKLGLLKNEAVTKGKINICDDVWIGNDCTILSGVNIGKGAVIGTGSVIAKDIPPYAIVVGNPGKIIKYRFNQNIINKLLEIDLKKVARLDNIINHVDYLYRVIDDENFDKIYNYFDGLNCIENL